MYPDKIFGLFTMYGVCVGVGLLFCFLFLWWAFKRMKIQESFTDFVTVNAVVAIVIGFGAAALFQSIYDYIANPEAGFQYGGLTFIGGLIGGAISFLIGYLIFRNKFQSKLIDAISIIPCSIIIAHAWGRVGCFHAGCCYGLPTDSIWGMQFVGMAEKVFPTNLYEAIFLFVLFAVCAFLLIKFKFKHNMSVYLISYGIFRFLIEYIRNDDRGSFVPGMSPSQFWSIVMVVLGIALIFILQPLFKKREAYLAEHPIVEPPKKEKKAKEAK